jgi:hypothetical protein
MKPMGSGVFTGTIHSRAPLTKSNVISDRRAQQIPARITGLESNHIFVEAPRTHLEHKKGFRILCPCRTHSSNGFARTWRNAIGGTSARARRQRLDLWWLILAAAAALAGVVAVGYVIYLAPTLLAEAAVDVAIAGKVYQGLRKRDASHWTTHVIRRTAVAAVILIVSATLAGYALQRIAPDARSIGGVWHAVAR